MRAHNDHSRRIYLDRVFERLQGPDHDRIVAKAHALLMKWEESTNVHPHYARRWRELLGQPLEQMRVAVMSDGAEAEALRHCMPFAGILSNRERAELRGF